MTDASRAAKVLWVVAIALLSVTFLVAGIEGLKWAFNSPSLFSPTHARLSGCGRLTRENPGNLARQLTPFAGAALLRACRDQQRGDVAG